MEYKWKYKILNAEGDIVKGVLNTSKTATQICWTFEAGGNEVLSLSRIEEIFPFHAITIPKFKEGYNYA